MKIHQIRNATLIITYNGKKFLIDPWLGPKDYMPGFEGAYNSHIRQPREELPIDIKTIVDVDAVILTHFHPDHWDKYAEEAIKKDIPFFVQSKTDYDIISSYGFNNIKILSYDGTEIFDTTLYKTDCQHGKREIIKPICESIGMPYDAMGIVFKTNNEKTLYIAGDTIFVDEVKQAINKFKPEIIVVNACGAMLLNNEKIIMDDNDVKAVANFAKNSIIVVSHLDNVSHLTTTRQDIENLKLSNVLIPHNNDILEF